MRPRRGFTRQEPWIPLLIVVILAALAVPRLLRVRRELAARALLRQDVERLAQAERDARQRGAAPGSTLAIVPLSPNARLVLKRAAAVGLAI
ncbi:MAG: hypothetical protein HY275_15655, partial [Gemmatimonadetes bacterium]|nr:hypothetical protein [Gemmatimonadota bacterium]